MRVLPIFSNSHIVFFFISELVTEFNNLKTKTYEYWVNKLELTKTSVTSKRELIHPNVDVSFLAFLVGVIDGDGYIYGRKKSNGYFEFNLVIALHNRDLATLEYILGKLHCGSIVKVNADSSKLVLYGYELKYVLVPLLLKHGLFFLTENRTKQYNLLLYTIENNIKKWELLPEVIPNYSPFVFNNPVDILSKVWYFKDWLVGFVVVGLNLEPVTILKIYTFIRLTCVVKSIICSITGINLTMLQKTWYSKIVCFEVFQYINQIISFSQYISSQNFPGNENFEFRRYER